MLTPEERKAAEEYAATCDYDDLFPKLLRELDVAEGKISRFAAEWYAWRDDKHMRAAAEALLALRDSVVGSATGEVANGLLLAALRKMQIERDDLLANLDVCIDERHAALQAAREYKEMAERQ